jgi:hypothetical protein
MKEKAEEENGSTGQLEIRVVVSCVGGSVSDPDSVILY